MSQRTREIGIRRAVGAGQEHIVRLVLGRVLAVSGIAVVLGIGTSFGLVKLVSGLLFGVSPADPVVLIGVPLLVLVISLIATYLPARRALRLDPAIVLRTE